MANTKSSKKNVRASARKKAHNDAWKKKYKDIIKELKIETAVSKKPDPAVLTSKLRDLQKTLDKAAKEKVIHKNKANRLKSIYAKKISAPLPERKAKGEKSSK